MRPQSWRFRTEALRSALRYSERVAQQGPTADTNQPTPIDSWYYLAAIVALSRTYCGMIRRGVRVPHPRHWEALRELVRPPEP